MSRLLLNSAQVAAKLGHRLGWFQRHRLALEAKGFPGPVDGCGLRWDEVAIDRWLDAAAGPAPPPPPAPEDVLVKRARAMAAC